MKKFLKKIFFRKFSKEIFLINSDEQKDLVSDALEKASILGLDTEFDWRNTYFPILSLLQIATSKKIFLIDCISCKNLEWLKSLLENKNKLIIIHSSRSDTTVLSTNLNIKIKNVFDIQVAEKNIYGGDVKSYGSIVGNYFPITLDKSETNSNWLKRPFSDEQLNYAAEDVSYLIEIYEKQSKKLKKINLLNETYEDSKKEANFGNQELHVSRIKKLKKLNKLEKEIFLWREGYAKKENIPPNHIFSNRCLRTLTKEIKSKNFDKTLCKNFFKKDNFAEDFFKDMEH